MINILNAALLTVYSYQDSSASSTLVIRHGLLYIRFDLQAVPLHPLSITDQNHVGGCLEAYTNIILV